MAPTLFTSPSASCNALPPEGALRLRPGKAGSAALAGEEGSRSRFAARMAMRMLPLVSALATLGLLSSFAMAQGVQPVSRIVTLAPSLTEAV